MQNHIDDEHVKPIDPGEGVYRGQFGFRNRGNRTGLDPWDTEMEAAQAEGLFLKALFTLRLKTRNSLGLLLMGIAAVVVLMPFEFSLAEALAGVPPGNLSLAPVFQFPTAYLEAQLECLGGLFIFALFGVLLLINLILSLRDLFKPPND